MARKTKSQLENIYNKATQLGKENSVMKVAELLGYKNIFTFKNDLLNACTMCTYPYIKFCIDRFQEKAARMHLTCRCLDPERLDVCTAERPEIHAT